MCHHTFIIKKNKHIFKEICLKRLLVYSASTAPHPPHVMVRNAPALGQHPPHVMVRNAPALGQPHIPMGFRQAFHCEVALFCCLLLPTGSVHVFILLLGLIQSLLKSPFRMRNCQHPSPVHCHVSGQGPQTPHPYRHLLHIYCKGANSSFTLLL